MNITIKSQMNAQLTQSVIRGESVQKAAKRLLGDGLTQEGLVKPFPSVYDRARTIAKTEIANGANLSHLAKYQQAEQAMPGLLVRWSSCLCSTTCQWCRAFHGMPPRRPGELWTVTLGSKTISVACPTAHPNCMCRLVAVVPS